ncbi:hypothetical protein QMK19_19170 [Streptomyces sp. H10-C2]|uniref:hypothetical protein n=1 Tax=Streptomyces sp. H10-C2 TaxID=3046210 RepID=UPI0024BB7807|nr:hypothetical protein [Streptomyces sp. H10-C2]MDJ0371742.1 hypothetical protein [Streptomyces sp. H10-C2]
MATDQSVVDVPVPTVSESRLGPPAAEEAGAKAGVEAGAKAGVEAGAKAGVEAGAKAGVEAGAEAGPDAGPEAVEDAGTSSASAAQAMTKTVRARFPFMIPSPWVPCSGVGQAIKVGPLSGM